MQNDKLLSPKICLISQEIPHSKAAGAIVLQRLLRNWPSEQLSIYGPPVPEGASVVRGTYNKFSPYAGRVQYSRLSPLAPPVAWLLGQLPYPVGDVTAKTVVLSVMQSIAYYRAAWAFAKRHRLPLALIVHDDPEEFEPGRWGTKPLVRNWNQTIYRYASIRFCVSQQMVDTLSTRYGATGEVLLPNRSANITPRAPELNKTLRRAGGMVIGYAGNSVSYGYAEKLAEILPLFRQLGATLRVYGDEQGFPNQPGIEFAGRHDDPESLWPVVQQECDAVILAYATSPPEGDRHSRLYRTHFPSKLTEYLALGMPVIVTGPSYASGVQWALNHPGACAVAISEDSLALQEQVTRLASDSTYRTGLARAALDAATGELAPEKIERQFRERLIEIGLRSSA